MNMYIDKQFMHLSFFKGNMYANFASNKIIQEFQS